MNRYGFLVYSNYVVILDYKSMEQIEHAVQLDRSILINFLETSISISFHSLFLLLIEVRVDMS